jgi:hypothetical protein
MVRAVGIGGVRYGHWPSREEAWRCGAVISVDGNHDEFKSENKFCRFRKHRLW